MSDVPSAPPTITTSYGQWASFSVPDGWGVVLAPASTLRLPAIHGARHRAVEFEGEAAFTVTHGEQPFTVRVGPITAVAEHPGTRFVVRSYPEDTLTDVVVLDGTVTVTHDSAPAQVGDSLVVPRGSRARATPDGFLALTPDVPLDRYAWFASTELELSGTLREVVSQIEQWQHVAIDLAESVRYTLIPTPCQKGESLLVARCKGTNSWMRREPINTAIVFRGDESPAEALALIAARHHLKVVPTGPRSYALREQ